ncbi:MAG: hypothetical protein J6B97_02920 [Bacteroidales bacterium]|nr:hypothetical protein [Bacteroidales bacterium]
MKAKSPAFALYAFDISANPPTTLTTASHRGVLSSSSGCAASRSLLKSGAHHVHSVKEHTEGSQQSEKL